MNALLTVLSNAFELGPHGLRWSLIAGFYAALIATIVFPVELPLPPLVYSRPKKFAVGNRSASPFDSDCPR